jgi:hypothetical protein
VCNIERWSVSIEFENSICGITLYNKSRGINFGSSGTFTPSSNNNSYWRAIMVASILKNFDAICKLVDKYCNDLEMDMQKRIKEQENGNR